MKGCRLLVALVAALTATAILPARAQAPEPLMPAAPAPGEQLLLEADELHYDFDAQTITAVGNVSIARGAAVLDAERVVYDQKSGRLTATGGVRFLEPNGNIITAETVDITDDFRDGFIQSLNVITTDQARFSAESAERRGADLLIFRKGVYTACAACPDNPAKPPLWQIKAARIIHDRSERTVYYRDATLEFFGLPIAYLPVFFHPDPTVTRKTGFLLPTFVGTEAIGYGVTAPFFYNLAPNYDVTFAPTFLSRQGVLMEAQWRHRVNDGTYSVRFSGIRQLDPGAFEQDGESLSGEREWRGSVNTVGEFAINPEWSYGWDAHLTSDRTFNRDYRIDGATAKDLTSTVYLTGISDRNFFDLRGYYFNVQREDTVEDIPGDEDYVHDDQAEQAIVHPVIDHNYIWDTPVLGGEVRFDSNLTSLSRAESDIRHPREPFGSYFAGVAGSYTRTSSRATWRRRFIAPGGQVVTPFSYVQGDANWLYSDVDESGLTSEEVVGRGMPAVGVEYEWPILATLGNSQHVFGPKAQLIARPSEQEAGNLPNEDSQSLVFDDSNLFVYDKFTGYDRQEGGTRANVGFTYTGQFANGFSVDALVGQSYQLAGKNSFALDDHALTGVGSGLESDTSDYVSRVTVNTGANLALTARGRFADEDLNINRGEVNALGTFGRSVGSVGYAYIRESPAAGIFRDRQEINAAASLAVTENWAVLGQVIYDLQYFGDVSHSVGFAYTDECFELSAVYSETPDLYSDLVGDRKVFVRFNLRTLGTSSLTQQLRDDVE